MELSKKNFPGGWPWQLINRRVILDFLDKHKITPVEFEQHTTRGTEGSSSDNFMMRLVKYGPYPPAHIHLEDKFYLLTEKQWNEFSLVVIKEFANAIGNAKSISFDAAKELGSALMQLER